jgi:hypothetical protein
MVAINDCALIECINPATERLFGYMPLAESHCSTSRGENQWHPLREVNGHD